MLTIRRLYIYLAAAASLAIFVTGLTSAAAAAVDLLFRSGAIEATYRQTIAISGAEIAVALPLWLLHWNLAQRLSGRDPTERAATLRRLYLYGALSALLVSLGVLAYRSIEIALALSLGAGRLADDATATGLGRTVVKLAIVAAFWIYTLRIADTDRSGVGETGGSATLRRWYSYGAQFGALLFTLYGATTLLSTILVDLIARRTALSPGPTVAQSVAQTLTGLGIWLLHRRWADRGSVRADDQQSTLRAVYGFGITAVAVAVTLSRAGQIFYWVMARLLGVPQPSGLSNDPIVALGGAIAACLVFGAAWILIRRDLERDAVTAPAGRQIGVRRLYRHLIAFLALSVIAAGAGLLLWTLADQLLDPGAAGTVFLRDRISLAVTLLVIGLPVWLLHWRPVVDTDERLALSRRIYLFASLLASVLAGLGSAIWLASKLLNILLGVPGPHPALDIGHATALLLVALAIAAYHARVLWVDYSSTRQISVGLKAVDAPTEPDNDAASTLIVVEIAGSTEREVRAALGRLPAGATYQLSVR